MDRNMNKIVYVHIYDKPLWIKIKIVNHVTTFFIKTKIIIYFEDFWDEKLKSFRFYIRLLDVNAIKNLDGTNWKLKSHLCTNKRSFLAPLYIMPEKYKLYLH